MSDPHNLRILQRIWAVLAGFLAGAILSLGMDAILHAMGVFPPWGQRLGDAPLVLATAYRVLFGIVGGYATARLAPSRPMLHALMLGAIGFVLCIVGALTTWNKGLGPHWYPLALVATAIPCAWLGGKFSVITSGVRPVSP
jgi:hypothetical protein